MPEDSEYNTDGSRKKNSPAPQAGAGRKVLDAEMMAKNSKPAKKKAK